MLEKDIENLITQHPDDIFPGEELTLIGQQIVVEGRRLDIVFADKHKRKIIVEVKRGILTREASGQIAEYYGLLKNANQAENYELVLCANIIPKERKTFLETIGIECKELGGGCKKLCVNGHRRLQPVTTGGTDGHTERRARLPDEGLQKS